MKTTAVTDRNSQPWCVVAALAFLLLALATGLPEAALAQEGEVTLFLPWRVHTDADAMDLTRLADQALAEAAGGRNASLLDRATAEALFPAGSQWPPAYASLVALAQERGAAYVAVGSLTRLGTGLSADLALVDSASEDGTTHYYEAAPSTAELFTVARSLVGRALAHAGRFHQIASLAVTGNNRIDAAAILRTVTSRPGDRLDRVRLRDDLKAIFRMGSFDDVRVAVEETEKGAAVVFQVTEKPVIHAIRFTGMEELEEKDLKEVVSIGANTILNTRLLKESEDKIRKLYKEKGFYSATVEAKLTPLADNQVDVEIAVVEGPEVAIEEIRIVGNTAFDAGDLTDVMETSEKGLFSWLTESGRLKREVLDQDLERIAAFYHNHGFIDAKVGTPEISQEEDRLFITIPVQEGARYRVRSVQIAGDLLASEEILLTHVLSGKDEDAFFSRKLLREDVLRINDIYADRGYAFVEVRPDVKRDDEARQVDITISVSQGALVHVNRIDIRGNTRTRDKVIRRELAVRELDVFSAGAMRTSNSRLQRLDYFEEVHITPEPGLAENTMDVTVEVKEKPTGAFSIGAGYSSAESLLFMAEISEKNFLGKGQNLSLQANLSSVTNRYNLSFTEPRWNDTHLLVGFDLYDWTREYDSFTKDATGGQLRTAYPLWEKIVGSLAYGYEHVQLTDVSANASVFIRDSQAINVTSAATLGLRRDTRDRLYDASSGSDHGVSVKYAGGPLGGDSAFTKMEARSGWYFPFLHKDVTYHLEGTIGYAFENKGGRLPVYEKFFLGGINSIRGFDSAHISPKDPDTGERIGGEKMWMMNAEWIFPLVKEAGLKGVVFFDVGNVYRDSEGWDARFLKKATGAGFRWMSPLGPLRLEWGLNLDPVDDEDRTNWDFSIGGRF
ncbi:MAG: outer membrane protein assembly factor BamA [Thermodesulfobacteriota bacterium]